MSTSLLMVLRERLPAARAEVMRLGEACGVPPHTVLKIWSGETTNPRIKTVEALMARLGISVRDTEDAGLQEPPVPSAVVDVPVRVIAIPNRRAVAVAIGSSDAYLWQLETGRRRPSRWMAEAIERATAGEVPCWKLRPDLFEAPCGHGIESSGARASGGVVVSSA